MAFSPDGRRLASAGYPWVTVWDTSTGRETLSFHGHASDLESITFSPGGEMLAAASQDGTVKIWDPTSGKNFLTRKNRDLGRLPLKGVQSVAFSPDGQRLASAGEDNTVKVWDALTAQDILALKGHTDAVTGVAFSPDGKRLASASEDKTVKVWDTGTGLATLTLKGHTEPVTNVVFSPKTSVI